MLGIIVLGVSCVSYRSIKLASVEVGELSINGIVNVKGGLWVKIVVVEARRIQKAGGSRNEDSQRRNEAQYGGQKE